MRLVSPAFQRHTWGKESIRHVGIEILGRPVFSGRGLEAGEAIHRLSFY